MKKLQKYMLILATVLLVCAVLTPSLFWTVCMTFNAILLLISACVFAPTNYKTNK